MPVECIAYTMTQASPTMGTGHEAGGPAAASTSMIWTRLESKHHHHHSNLLHWLVHKSTKNVNGLLQALRTVQDVSDRK